MAPKTLEEFKKLSPIEPEELVGLDWENYTDDVRFEHETPEFFAELDRRMAEHRANPSSAIPWAEVRRKLRLLADE